MGMVSPKPFYSRIFYEMWLIQLLRYLHIESYRHLHLPGRLVVGTAEADLVELEAGHFGACRAKLKTDIETPKTFYSSTYTWWTIRWPSKISLKIREIGIKIHQRYQRCREIRIEPWKLRRNRGFNHQQNRDLTNERSLNWVCMIVPVHVCTTEK